MGGAKFKTIVKLKDSNAWRWKRVSDRETQPLRFRMRCRAVLLKSTGPSSKAIGLQTEMSHVSVNSWVKRFLSEASTACRPVPAVGAKTYMGLYERGSCSAAKALRNRTGQSVTKLGSLAERPLAGSERPDIQAFLSALRKI